MQTDIAVLESPAQAIAVLDPVRAKLLEYFREPDSAAGAARALRLPRQRLGYHVRELERTGLLETAGERKRRNCVERLLQATARQFVISPAALGPGRLSGEEIRDRFSSDFLIVAAARIVEDVAVLQRLAAEAHKALPTLIIETEVRFASAEAQHAFATELAQSVARLIEKHHDEHSPPGRRFRVVAAAHPVLTRRPQAV